MPEGWSRTEFVAQLFRRGLSVVASDAFAVGAPPQAIRLGLGAARTREDLGVCPHPAQRHAQAVGRNFDSCVASGRSCDVSGNRGPMRSAGDNAWRYAVRDAGRLTSRCFEPAGRPYFRIGHERTRGSALVAAWRSCVTENSWLNAEGSPSTLRLPPQPTSSLSQMRRSLASRAMRLPPDRSLSCFPADTRIPAITGKGP